MPWVRIDDEFPHHPKVAPVGPFGVALQVAGLCYSNHYLTDGFIPFGAVRTLLDFNRLGENIGDQVEVWVELGGMVIAHRLVEAGMWEEVPGGFQIHDYEEYQPSRAEVEAERKKTRDRVAKYREGKTRNRRTNKGSNRSSNDVTNTESNAAGSGPVTGAPVPVPEPLVLTSGSTSTSPHVATSSVEQARPIDDVVLVFQTWQASTGKQRAKLDGNRRYAIQDALDRYDTDDVLAAVQGWVNDPWPDRPQQNDIVQLLWMGTRRKPQNVLEKMRDLWRDGPPRQVSKQTAQAIRTSQANRARAQQREVMNGEHDLRRVGRVGGPPQRGLSAPAD